MKDSWSASLNFSFWSLRLASTRRLQHSLAPLRLVCAANCNFFGLWEWSASWYVATFLCFAIIYFNGVRCEPVEPPHLDWNYLEVGFLRCLGAPPSNRQNRLELRNTPQTAIRCCYQYSEFFKKTWKELLCLFYFCDVDIYQVYLLSSK